MGTDPSICPAGRDNPLFRRHVRDHHLRQEQVLHHQRHHPRGADPLAFERNETLADDHAIGRVGAHTGAFAGNAVQLLPLLEEGEDEL